ncbi:uncharacterized protein FOMMEDRAFT_27094 [Fomitiporia mediterranea MF3/22]|uniref:uncharacterized protein n=1 Tax=Fomitiporia mediterranea (strain MF3/22) TaxID=694068 RepID=UPI000440828A|nr:uncharacterized protein FOMMEDRAFT_27094 [Fomitiporia mediterranea MF3/22]EJD04779.1 hypothetical protein FOMMEDRAFT_27094 [Fomitiporia mediterranea MF3/22]
MHKKTRKEKRQPRLTPTWDMMVQRLHDSEEPKEATDAFDRAVARVRKRIHEQKVKTSKRYERYTFYNNIIKRVEQLCKDIENQANESVRYDNDDTDLQNEFQSVAVEGVRALNKAKKKIDALSDRLQKLHVSQAALVPDTTRFDETVSAGKEAVKLQNVKAINTATDQVNAIFSRLG